MCHLLVNRNDASKLKSNHEDCTNLLRASVESACLNKAQYITDNLPDNWENVFEQVFGSYRSIQNIKKTKFLSANRRRILHLRKHWHKLLLKSFFTQNVQTNKLLRNL